MVMIKPGFSDLLVEGVYEVVSDGFKQREKEYDKILNLETSKKHSELTTTMEGLGIAPIKLENADTAFADLTQGFDQTTIHSTYSYGIEVSFELYDDDLYNIIKNASRYLGKSIRQRMEVSAANVFNNAFALAGPDGSTLCAVAHPWARGGTWSNRLAVDADLSVASIESMLTLIETTNDAGGTNLALMPKRVLVAPANRFNASVILESQKKSGTAHNDKNVLLDMDMSFMVGHYFTDPKAWFVECDEHYAYFFERMKPKFESDDDFKSGNALFKVTNRLSTAWATGMGIAGTPGT